MQISLGFFASGVLVYLVGLAVARRPIRECNATSDCRRGECCVAPSLRSGEGSSQARCAKIWKTRAGSCISDTLNMPCSSGTQCGRKECCVSNTRPIGKRSTDEPGTCKQMGTSGSNCLVNNGSGKPTDLVFESCPCSTGFTCVGSGIHDIPLGEIGTCTKEPCSSEGRSSHEHSPE